MEFSEQMLILQVGKFKEADLWIRFLSPTRGILSGFAFGGSRSKRRFTGCLDTFNEVLLRVRASRRGAYMALQEGVLIRGPLRLRSDWARYGMANNCVKFMQSFGIGPDGADKAHFVLREVLQLLEEAAILPVQLPLFFRARLAFDQGYSLDLSACALCGKSLAGRGALFPVEEGHFLCPNCAPHARVTGRRTELGTEALDILRAMRDTPPSTWGEMPLSSKAGSECARAIEGFIQHHVGLVWENGYFARV